jgi:hypothetical protein
MPVLVPKEVLQMGIGSGDASRITSPQGFGVAQAENGAEVPLNLHLSQKVGFAGKGIEAGERMRDDRLILETGCHDDREPIEVLSDKLEDTELRHGLYKD